MTDRNCNAFACAARIGMGATFCEYHWNLIPAELRSTIMQLSTRARKGQGDQVQHRLMHTILVARQKVSTIEQRGAQPIAPAYKVRADEEANRELAAA